MRNGGGISSAVAVSIEQFQRKGVTDFMSNHSQSLQPSVQELILQARQGDQNSFETLLERYTPLIDSMTSRFSIPSFSVQDREDLRQEALVAFYCAVKSYRIEQDSVQFGLYAKDCIRNRLISYLRSVKKHEQLLLLDDEDVTVTDALTETDPAERLLEEEAYLELYRRVRQTLSEYENGVWWLFLSGRTAKEIAAQLGTDEKSIQNALYRIRRKLRATLPSP